MLGYFGKYTESYPGSWARKIIWVYQKLKERGEDFTGWILDIGSEKEEFSRSYSLFDETYR